MTMNLTNVSLNILTNCPLANCPLAKCPLAKCPLAKCHGFVGNIPLREIVIAAGVLSSPDCPRQHASPSENM